MGKQDDGCRKKHKYEHEDGCRKMYNNRGKEEREPLLVIPGAEISDTRKPKFCIETGAVYRECVGFGASGHSKMRGGDKHGEDQKVFQR
jgi:hypothetical protein